LGGKIIHGRPRHPQSQGVVERLNQTLKKMLYNFPDCWSEKLKEITSSYNTTRHSTTKYSPFQSETRTRPQLDRTIPFLQEAEKIEIIHEKIKLNIEKNANCMKKNMIKIY